MHDEVSNQLIDESSNIHWKHKSNQTSRYKLTPSKNRTQESGQEYTVQKCTFQNTYKSVKVQNCSFEF